DARRAEIVADYEAELLHPYQAAELGYVDAVVPPHATRGHLVRALRATYHKREARPAKKHGNMPL
ncbi:methylmalonyl-CoA carboxyltransferase, partial [Xanthomonas citri pv. citri]|nr:methylmalonyl-CoA carboxyltransferase [Xanthomonas citri pv. citri]